MLSEGLEIMPQVTKNLLIGLGGTGQKILLETKASMLNQFGTVPSSIRFLAFDTDVPDEATRDLYTGKKIQFEGSEFFRLSGNGATAVAQEAEGSWWPKGCTDWPLPGAGAAAKRMHGRAKLGLNINNVSSYIKSEINKVKTITEKGVDKHAEGKIRVFIACSLAGGTGAGCWLDIANLVHESLSSNDRIVGLMLLGDAFESLPGTTNKYANTVACLRELHWLLEKNLSPESEYFKYKLYHRDMSFPLGKIFNSCFLASKTIESGVADEHESMMKGLGRWLFHMCGPAGDEFDRREDNITASYPYKQPGTKGQTEKKGVFWSCGISELTYEANTENYRLAEDYSLRSLANILTGVDLEDPSNKSLDIDAFLVANKLQEYDADQVIDALFQPIEIENLANKFKAPPDEELQKSSSKDVYKKWRSACLKWPETAKAKSEEVQKTLLDNTIQVLKSKLEQMLVKPGGVTRARTFFKQLQSELVGQEEMMRDESEANLSAAKNKERNFHTLGAQHDQSPLPTIFWRSKVAAQVQGYIPIAKAWLKNAIESKRKEVAADLFHTIQKETGNIVDQIQRLEDNLGTAITSLRKAAAQRSRRIRSNFRREVKRPVSEDDKGLINIDATTRKFSNLNAKTMINKWASHECEPDEIRKKVFDFVQKELLKLSNTNILSVITGKGPDQLQMDIRDIYLRSTPLWKYDRGIIAQNQDHQTPHSALVTAGPATMPESIKGILESESGGGAPPAWVPVNNANYLALMQWEFNVPAFAIDCVKRQMLREYNNETLWTQNPVGFHLHCEWRKELPTIEPDSSQGQRKEIWILAMATQLIEERSNNFLVKNTIEMGNASSTGEYSHIIQTGIYQDAKIKFIENQRLCDNLHENITEIMNKEGTSNFYAKIIDYKDNTLAPKVRNSGMQTAKQASLSEDLDLLNKWIEKYSGGSDSPIGDTPDRGTQPA